MSAHFRLQLPPYHHHAVVVLVDGKRAAGVPLRGFPRLGLPVHLPPATHDPLDVVGRSGAAHRQQSLFGLRRGHAGQGANFGIRQLAAGESLAQKRQSPEGARHPDMLARRAPVEPHPPAQPGRAGPEAPVPSRPRVELPDEGQKMRGGGVEMRGQLGDLVAKSIEIRGMILSVNGSRRVDLHGESPRSAGATLHPDFRGPWERRGQAQHERGMIFGQPSSEHPTASLSVPLDGHSTSMGDA